MRNLRQRNTAPLPVLSRRHFLGAAAFALAAGSRILYAKSSVNRPNIVLIMADDMGFSDIGCYGGEIQTPVLDKLAANGVRFTQGYNAGRCCPTRASLLTGLYAHQTGIGHMTTEDEHNFDYGKPGYRGVLNRNCVTIAEALKPAGYHTWMVGKWHVGTARGHWPLDRGFERYYGIIRGACNYFKPAPEKRLAHDNDLVEKIPEDFYTTNAFTDHAIRFIKEQEDEKPFFLYVAYNAPHWPLNALPEDVKKYRGTYLKGWDALRDERLARQIEMGLIDKDWKLTERDKEVPEWDSLPEERKQELDHRMALYAAQVDRMDQNIGRLLEALDAVGKHDNTVVIFLADNGGCAEGNTFGGGPAKQLGTKEGYFLTYGRGWANASNTPFRRYKHWVHEGGIATPLIVRWPREINPAPNGTFQRNPVHIIDLMATCIDLAGAEYPKEYEGNAIHPLEGKSFASLLNGADGPIHDALFWEHEGNRAIHVGSWKLVSAFSEKEQKWELYNLETDRTETRDLAQEFPEKVRELSRQYEQWARTHNVEPWSVVRSLRKK